MSTGKTNRTSTQFAAKKLLGKAHTNNQFSDVNESIPSNVSVPFSTIFAQEIPNSPPTASFFASGSVEKVHFDVVELSNTIYDANDTDGGGDEASTNGAHGYYLKLPHNYETTSSNPQRGTGSFTNDTRVYNTRGALQLVPPLVSNANPNLYFLKLYKGEISDANEITSGDSVDWQIDYYSGVVFVQDYNSSTVPVSASGYLYSGDYLDAKITEISSSGGGISDVVTDTTPQLGGDLDVNGNDIVSVSNGNINLLPNGAGKVVMDGNGSTGGISVTDGTIEMRSGNGSPAEIKMYCEVNNAHYVRFAAPPHANFSGNPDFVLPPTEGTNGQVLKTDGSGNTSWTDAISYGRTAITSTGTASVSSRILGVSGSSAIDIRLPSAGDYAAGQHFTVKDESGAADIKNITILTSGSQTIDGVSSIVLESPFAAVNVYSDGTSKFFIY